MNHLQIKCLELSESPQDHYGRFIIQPFRANSALTFGNAIRRTLLGNLEGSAIVAIRIIGIDNEFSIIPGLREDTLELILNIKEIIVVNERGNSCLAKLCVVGPKIITAKDIEFPPDVELINPSHYLGTLSTDTQLEIEFKIENGIGYKLSKSIPSNNELDFLEIDAIFMPIKRANYCIEKLYKSEDEFIERLIFEIWTNGTISPRMALASACTILSATFFQAKQAFENVQPPDPVVPLVSAKSEVKSSLNQSFENITINDLTLSSRAYNGLKQAGINNLQELMDTLVNNPKHLKQVRNFGKKSFQEVLDVLEEQYKIFIDTQLRG